ncbi:phosphotransferase family protein [Kiloniella antarctica]|uniref:Phosphotransferase family protein n=1 Tax=Kiloniella antarctica TaxID=1550907 RepID=A0ABW5BRR5_9PROT
MEQVLSDNIKLDALAEFVGQALGRQGLVINNMFTMSGGAIQENWRLDYKCASGEQGCVVIRADAATCVPGSHSKRNEFDILSFVWRAGVRVPRPLALCEDQTLMGRPFVLMEYLPGTTNFEQIRAFGMGEALGFELGVELAQLHRLLPDELSFLKKSAYSPVEDLIDRYRVFFDDREGCNSVAEWAMRWCLVQQETRPVLPEVLVHGDFRTANYLVTRDGLVGLLDWEFSGWGDPYSDLGWFCARCWRYGHEVTPAGGISTRESFYKGYTSVTGEDVDHNQVLFWEVMSLLRWLVIAIQQGDRNFVDGENDLELGLTGLVRPFEIEMMLLEMTAPCHWPNKIDDIMEGEDAYS